MALLGAMVLLAQLAQVSTGDPNPDPRDSGEHQELSVRSQLAREGYKQPYGRTDAEIRANLKIEGKAADVVGYNPKTGRPFCLRHKNMDVIQTQNNGLLKQRRLTRLILQTDGQLEALRFAYDHRDNASAIRERLAESEEFLTDEFMLNGPMKPGADPPDVPRCLHCCAV